MLITTLGAASMLFVAVFTWRACSGSVNRRARIEAITEAWVNLVIGFSLNFVANLLLIPLMTQGAHLSTADNFWGGWIYTAISIVRQYTIRRWFATKLSAFKVQLAALFKETQ
jgi:hypothetical protein